MCGKILSEEKRRSFSFPFLRNLFLKNSPFFVDQPIFFPFYALLFIPDVFDDVFDDPFVMGVGFDQIFDLL